jgi:Bacterial Ig domain/Calx-beta domain
MKRIYPAPPAHGFFGVIGFWLALASAGFAQTSLVPVVTVRATQPIATVSNSGAFTVFRAGDTNATLNVWYDLGGTASNGVDYAAIAPHFIEIPAGLTSNTIVITPLTNPPPSSAVETVVLTLTNSPLMTPVNYEIGWPSVATVYIAPPGVSNLPPVVNLINPTNGATFYAPANVPLLVRAADPDGSVTNVEFFANGADLGPGWTIVLDPPGMNGVTGLLYYFDWQNVPTNEYALTAVATDNGGLSVTSAPIKIVVQLPPTNFPPVVRITSPPNHAVYRAPVKIPLYAYAADFDGSVSAVEFFADGANLGFGQPVMAVPPPLPPGPWQPPIVIFQPTNFWELTWTNPAPGTNIALTAVATDNVGLSTTSNPVLVSILPPLPPPTNRPAIVHIVATDPVAIEGTNCYTWRGLATPDATWSNWFAADAMFCLHTNCGPKNATLSVFRFGDTNNDLDVPYTISGTASNGVDYGALPGDVTIPAGERRADIPIVPLDDGPPDITSTVVLKLVPDVTGTNYLLGFPRAAGALILDSQSPQVSTGIVPGPAFNLTAAGPDGAWFHVEESADLIHWTPICTNQVVNGRIDFVDPDTATNPIRYYRAVPDAGPTP